MSCRLIAAHVCQGTSRPPPRIDHLLDRHRAMSTTQLEPPPLRPGPIEGSEPSIRAQVFGLLAALDRKPTVERRRDERFAYPQLVCLTPVAADGVTPVGEMVIVAGKHLSERGLGFYHPGPLPHRLVIASMEQAPDKWLHVLLDVSWCRFRRQGWYESGGRFLRRAEQAPDIKDSTR
jgi:hypothetical protein